MPGCISCAIAFPHLPKNKTKCFRCILIEQCSQEDDEIAAIQNQKQCQRCGYTTKLMPANVAHCAFCPEVTPPPTTPKGKIDDPIIDLDSTPDRNSMMYQKYENDLRYKRNEVKTSDKRYKGDKLPKVELTRGKTSFGAYQGKCNIFAEEEIPHHQKERKARERAANHAAGITVVIQVIYAKELNESGKVTKYWKGMGKLPHSH